MNFNKDDVIRYINKKEIPYKWGPIIGTPFVLWILDLLLFMSGNVHSFAIFTAVLFVISNSIATITTLLYLKYKTIKYQNINLCAAMFSLCLFFMFFSFNIAGSTSIVELLLYISSMIILMVLTVLFVINRLPKEQKKVTKKTIIFNGVGIILLLVFLGRMYSLMNTYYRDVLVGLFGAIISMYISSTSALKAYLIKKYDLDKPVKIIEE